MSTTLSGSRAPAPTSPGGILNIGGTGRLITTQRVQTATTAVTVLADIYLQAVHRGNQAHANAILAMHPNVIDASWHRAARASLRSSGRVATVRCSASGFLEWSTMQTSLTTTGQRLAILGDWSGFTIVDRLGAQIELIPHLFSATNRFPTGPSAGSCTSAIFVVCHQAEHAALDLLRIAS
jgi:predicted phage gp36 major capsid-like protein